MSPLKYSQKATLIGIIAGIFISIGILVLLALWPVQYESSLIPYQESGAPAGRTGDFAAPASGSAPVAPGTILAHDSDPADTLQTDP